MFYEFLPLETETITSVLKTRFPSPHNPRINYIIETNKQLIFLSTFFLTNAYNPSVVDTFNIPLNLFPLLKKFLQSYIPSHTICIPEYQQYNVGIYLYRYIQKILLNSTTDDFYLTNNRKNKSLEKVLSAPVSVPLEYHPLFEYLYPLCSSKFLLPDVLYTCNIPLEVHYNSDFIFPLTY